MIDRDRAWRRRKARTVLHKEQDTKMILEKTATVPPAKGVPPQEAKQHRHGALTGVQALRQTVALGQEVRDGLDLDAESGTSPAA